MEMNLVLSALYKEKNRRAFENSLLDWESMARPEQKLPEGAWFGWLIMAGRGFGKTRTGAETIKQFALSGKYKRICLLGETYDQVRSIMIEGESGLLNIHSKQDRPTFKPTKRELVWPNGCIATCYSAENYEALRGPQFDCAWVDELAKFDNAEKVWDQLMFCLRLGSAPRVIMTTTPRPRKIIYELINRSDIHLTQGKTFDNSANLSKDFLAMIEKQYSNTKLGEQEINGNLISLDDSALWCYADFQYHNLTKDQIAKLDVTIAIDPATTSNENSNETGIIIIGKKNDKYYLLDDLSGIFKPEIWAMKAAAAYKKYNAKQIIVETNQGGEILLAMLKSIADLPWESVRAQKSKLARAESIAVLYKQKKVYHIKRFEKLEEQLIKAHINFADDRLDALTWALFSSMQQKKATNDDDDWECF